MDRVIERVEGDFGPEYVLTNSGKELADLIGLLGVWGQRWLERDAVFEDLDLDPILVDMVRRVCFSNIPKKPLVVRFEFERRKPQFMLIKSGEASICLKNPGFPEAVKISGALSALASWWRGDVKFIEACRAGLELEGQKSLVRAFPSWFLRYQFADVKSAL